MNKIILISLLLFSCSTVPKSVLTCPIPERENLTDLPWDDEDERIFQFHLKQDGCIRHYSELPCLIKFNKINELSYHIECGKRR